MSKNKIYKGVLMIHPLHEDLCSTIYNYDNNTEYDLIEDSEFPIWHWANGNTVSFKVIKKGIAVLCNDLKRRS